MARYNVYEPYVVGSLFAPLRESEVTLDTATEIGYRFVGIEPIGGNDAVVWVRVLTTKPPSGLADRSELVARLYDGDAPADVCTPAKRMIIPCSSGTVSGGTLEGGAGSVQEAVGNPSDGMSVRLSGPSAYARFWFATDAVPVSDELFLWRTMIADVTVLYTVCGPFGELTTNTMSLALERPTDSKIRYMDRLITGPATADTITEIKKSRLGELNPFWDDQIDPNTDYVRGPWIYRSDEDCGLYALRASGGTNVDVRLETDATAAGDYDIRYVALQITYRVSGSLIGAGGVDMTGGIEVAEGLYAYLMPVMPAWDTWDWLGGGGNSLVGTTEGLPSTITVSRAYSGSVSMTSPVPLVVSTLDTISQVIPGLSGVQLTKPMTEGSIPEGQDVTTLPAIVVYDCDPVDPDPATELIPANVNTSCHPYLQQTAEVVQDDGSWLVEQILPDVTPGTFPWITFYARAAATIDGALVVEQVDAFLASLGPIAEITYEEFAALPEITDGWRRVTLRFDPEPVLAGLGGVTYWMLWSRSSAQRVWEILGATANPTILAAGASSGAVATYEGETAYASPTAGDVYPEDMSLFLAQEMTEVTGLAVSQAIQDLQVVDGCGGRIPCCLPTGIVYVHLEWDLVLTAMVSGWGAYEVQRRDETMDPDVWETIAAITTPYVGEMDDYEARIGVEVSYRIRTTHVTGIAGPWSSEVTTTIAIPGVTLAWDCEEVGVLALTTNQDPGKNLAYVHSTEAEDFTMVESGQASLTPVYRRDYQVAARPVERGGVIFTRTVMVNLVCVPQATLDRGLTGLRDLAWDAVPYVCVRDELANRWLANVDVPAGTTRRFGGPVDPYHDRDGWAAGLDRCADHLQLAQLVVTEVTDEPAPVDAPTPFLGFVGGSRETATATADVPAGFATLVDVDVRVKIIATAEDAYVGVERYYAGPPESWWGITHYLYNGKVTDFYVLGDGGTFVEEVDMIVPILNQPTWLRAVYDHDIGGGQASVTFYSSLDGSSWTSHGTYTDTAADLLNSADGTMTVIINDSVIVQEVLVIDASTSTTLMSPDFSAQDEDTTTFVDAQSNTWTITRV